MPIFIVLCGDKALKVLPPDKVSFIDDKRLANFYSSRYAAKNHLKQLDGIPNDAQIIEFKFNEVNYNGN